MMVYGLAKAGFGTCLVHGVVNSSMGTAVFLRSWQEALCEELCINRVGQLLKHLTKVASLIPADFPDINILNLYLTPHTTDYATHPFVLIPGQGVDWPSLALFCEQSFTWADASGILRYFTYTSFLGMLFGSSSWLLLPWIQGWSQTVSSLVTLFLSTNILVHSWMISVLPSQ